MIRKFRNLLSETLNNKLIRFFLVSGLNTAFGYGLFALLIFLGIVYPLALLISTIAGILFNFKTIGGLVFNNHNNILIFKFIGVYGVSYLFNLGGLALINYFGINIYWAGAMLLIPTGLFAYILNKTFVFKNYTKEIVVR
jgi:putative flippase GtrA